MKREVIENYIFTGFGFPIQLPFAIFKENERGISYLDIDMKELEDRVAFQLMLHPYAYTGAILHFIRNYLNLSTIQLAKTLSVVQQTISNWEKKKNSPIPLNNRQRSYLLLQLKQHFFNKKETDINEAILKFKDSSKIIDHRPLIIDRLYLAS